MKRLIPILLIFILLSSCERKSGSGNISRGLKQKAELAKKDDLQRNEIEHQNFDDCICQNALCDYCVKVVAITDGDTFKGLSENKELIIFRIYGIDAPEKRQAFGTKSKEYLSNLIFGKNVGIKFKSKDRNGRLIVWVYTSDGKDISAEMLKAGMAWHFKKYDDTELYKITEDFAKEKSIGLWIDNNPIAPWDFRN